MVRPIGKREGNSRNTGPARSRNDGLKSLSSLKYAVSRTTASVMMNNDTLNSEELDKLEGAGGELLSTALVSASAQRSGEESVNLFYPF